MYRLQMVPTNGLKTSMKHGGTGGQDILCRYLLSLHQLVAGQVRKLPFSRGKTLHFFFSIALLCCWLQILSSSVAMHGIYNLYFREFDGNSVKIWKKKMAVGDP